MEFIAFSEKDIAQAAKLLSNRHKMERRAFPALKKEFEDSANTRRILDSAMEEGSVKGVCAYENEELRGFILSNIENDSVLGRCAFVDYAGLAIAEGESPELYRRLYAEIAKVWLENGALYHYVQVPAGCKDTVDAWLRLSFAFQQVYGITDLSRTEAGVPGELRVKRAEESDAEALRGVSNLIYSYQAGSPTYAAALPERVERIREGYGELPKDDTAIALLAYGGDKLQGFICADIEEDDSNMMIPEKAFEISVCGTVEESRKSGIGGLLTRLMINEAVELGYENAIADWRITNLDSSLFWPNRGFKPVAYRMVRTIDERVYWATGKLAGEK